MDSKVLDPISGQKELVPCSTSTEETERPTGGVPVTNGATVISEVRLVIEVTDEKPVVRVNRFVNLVVLNSTRSYPKDLSTTLTG